MASVAFNPTKPKEPWFCSFCGDDIYKKYGWMRTYRLRGAIYYCYCCFECFKRVNR